ncbi:MAG TPA: hypothetical protein EYQ25_08590 [Planctomycetes bacterium]|nr:hypothetical protein [Planctomycetota bacterium]HIL37274.1 hypothetical protein [Planctomycetota bacterium]
MRMGIDRNLLATNVANMDQLQRKIVGGLLVVLFHNPSRIQDQEWLLEQLTQVMILAEDFKSPEAVQAYLKAHVHDLLNTALRIFGCVGEDLAPRATEGITHQDAMLLALTYLDRPETSLDKPST